MKILIVNGKYIIFLLAIIIINITWAQHYPFYDNNKNSNDQVEIFDENTLNNMLNSQVEQINCVFEREGTKVCNCGYKNGEMILPKFAGNIFRINLLNCKTLRIMPNTFSDLQISMVRFQNIEELILEERSLLFPPKLNGDRIRLEFVNTVIEEINSHSISGNIDEIHFDNVKIGVIQPFAVTGINKSLSRFSILNSTINRIEPQAFKKFAVDDFEIISTNFISDIPSRSFYDIEIKQNLRIRNSNFNRIHSSAFVFQEVSSFIMSNNTVYLLNGESFRMAIRNSIEIRDNNFGTMNNAAFRMITIDPNYFARNSEPLNFNFISNKLQLQLIEGPQTIYFYNRFNMRISDLYITNSLTCEKIEKLRNNEFLNLYSDAIYFRMSDLLEDADNEETKFHSFNYILNHKCIEESYLIYIIIGIVALIIILVIILTVVLCICLKRRRDRRLDVVVPDGKTYRETQIIMQIENHGLLKTDL